MTVDVSRVEVMGVLEGKWNPNKNGGSAKQRRWVDRYYNHVKFEYEKMTARDERNKKKEKAQ